ncbi:hypothetical protein ACH427_20830 [Streptomyces sp. NPDC020379]|uniref:hypothetical protein n=1 Tax=Streptomyces sp. NPDC020379 TaxID=3365071 RepID=UPI003795C36C
MAFADDPSAESPGSLRELARRAASPLAWFALASLCLGGFGYLAYRVLLLRVQATVDIATGKGGWFHFAWTVALGDLLLNVAVLAMFAALIFVFFEGVTSACMIALFVSRKLLLLLKTHDLLRKTLLVIGAAFLHLALALQFAATYVAPE